MADLIGKNVLITGGGSGTGAVMARDFATAGANVVITGRRAEPLQALADQYDNMRFVTGDVADEASVAAMFEEAGSLDIVIANAGISSSNPMARTTLDQWNGMIATNLTGVFLTFREALKYLPRTGGRLIAVSSTAGLEGAAYVTAYSASKHGVMGLVRSLAIEVAKKNVTVNAICPGFLNTEMTDRTIANIMEKTGKDRDAAIAALTVNNPQGRLVEPEEVAAAARWLASDGAASVNGQALVLNGGEF